MQLYLILTVYDCISICNNFLLFQETDLDNMVDLISNENSNHQTIKCALYKMSVMLEFKNLQQYFIKNGGMNIILNLLKSSKVLIYMNYLIW